MEISHIIMHGPQSAIIDPIISSEIEGTLIVKVKNKIIFNEEDLLLLEFAIYIKQWLDRDEKPNFSYTSLEFDEKIFSLLKKKKIIYGELTQFSSINIKTIFMQHIQS